MGIRLSSISSLLSPILFGTVLNSCLSVDEPSITEPRSSIEEYIESNDVSDYTLTDSGLYYKVLSEGQDSTVLKSTDVVDYTVAIYAMNDDLIFDGFDESVVNFTSLGADAFALSGVVEACLLNNIGDSLSLLLPHELTYIAVYGSLASNEDLRIIVKPAHRRLTSLDYLEENNVEEYFSTASGLYYSFENEGEGDLPTTGQIVEVHYTGYLFDGTKFDSSVDREETFLFTLGAGQVIAGWDEGIALFKKGQKGKLYLPYNLAYGLTGAGDDIQPYDNLIFEIEMIDIR